MMQPTLSVANKDCYFLLIKCIDESNKTFFSIYHRVQSLLVSCKNYIEEGYFFFNEGVHYAEDRVFNRVLSRIFGLTYCIILVIKAL
jgi:hypothetical protein